MNKDILYRFFANQASKSEKEQIKNWLARDVSNYNILYRERAFFDAVMLVDDKSIEQQKHQNKVFSIPKLALQTMRWVAVLLIAFISSYLILQGLNRVNNDEFYNTISVPAGQFVSLTMADGTRVFLNANTSFSYPTQFGNSTRKVHLDGEAFFEVTRNEKHPFIVETNLCDVEVLGTKFNVDAYSKNGCFSAALMEGAVRIRNNQETLKEIDLIPDQTLVFQEHGEWQVNNIQDYDLYKWKEGLICFKELRFQDLMKRLEKYYDIKLVINKVSLLKYSFSGKFKISDGIDNLLRVLQKDVDFKFIRSEDSNTIYID